MQNLKKQFEVRTWPFSLTNTILTLLVIAFCVVFGVIYITLHYEGLHVQDTLSEKLLSAKSETIKNAIEARLDVPRQANAILRHSIAQRQENTIAPLSLRPEMLNILDNVFSDATRLNLIQFGDRNGNYIGFAHKPKGAQGEYLTLKSSATRGALISYTGTTQNTAIGMVKRDYKMANRPWFAPVEKERRSWWTDVYQDVNQAGESGITFSVPAYNRQGEYVGVIASELHLSTLNQLLTQLNPFPTGIILIVDNQKRIVAASGSGEKRTLALKALNQVRQGPGPLAIQADRYYVNRFPITGDDNRLKWQGILMIPASVMNQTLHRFSYVIFTTLFLVFSIGMLLTVTILSRLTLPLRAITRKAGQLASYQWTLSNEKRHFPEIASLEIAFSALSHKLSDSFDTLRKQLDEDPATGLLTRHGLLQQKALYKRRNLMGLVHISNMKTIINSLGEEYGDRFMNEFINRLRKLLPTDTLIARDKIDKLIVALPGINQHKDYQRYDDLLHSLFLNEYIEYHAAHQNYVFTGNAGIVLDDITPETVSSLLMKAWIALKQAQREGNTVVSLFSQEMHAQELCNIRLHECLSDAIHHHEFHLVLQPIIDKNAPHPCREGECLIRWHSQTLGSVGPERFIPLAEETGLIVPLGKWIIEQACRELAELIARGAPLDFRLHINISATQLSQPDFAWHLMDTISRNGLTNNNICVEIAESVLLQNSQRTGQMLNYLRRHCITIAIDNFGSGFSSLTCLHDLPFDSIKIDRHFITSLPDSSRRRSVISAMVVLAQGSGVPLIAVGIENEEAEKQLLELGCSKAQGNRFGHPARFSDWHYENGNLAYLTDNTVPEGTVEDLEEE
jgi:EAL domain-containing protein (putative c-di-GMP-specific phosphodiesterase class I)/GGDEF domain-containing protein